MPEHQAGRLGRLGRRAAHFCASSPATPQAGGEVKRNGSVGPFQGHGQNHDVGGEEGISAIPTTFIIDREGNIRDRKVGAEHTDEFEKRLVKYLPAKPAA